MVKRHTTGMIQLNTGGLEENWLMRGAKPWSTAAARGLDGGVGAFYKPLSFTGNL